MGALMKWVDRSGLGGEVGRLEYFVSQVDASELAEEVRRLEAMLFGRAGTEAVRGDWSGKRLCRAVRKARRELRGKTGRVQFMAKRLPALNP